MLPKREPRIVCFDIETLPNLIEGLKVWHQISDYEGRTLKADINSVICFGYKFLGEKTKIINAWDFPEWRKNVNDDSSLLKKIREILLAADAVVTQNGKKFDWKFLQTRFLINKMKPLPKTPHIDTCQLAKSNTLLFSNRLSNLAERFTDNRKMESGGWPLWVNVWHRDPLSMARMAKYCIQDVNATEAVFNEMRPFANNIPNFNFYKADDDRGVCPSCGSLKIIRHKRRPSKKGIIIQY